MGDNFNLLGYPPTTGIFVIFCQKTGKIRKNFIFFGHFSWELWKLWYLFYFTCDMGWKFLILSDTRCHRWTRWRLSWSPRDYWPGWSRCYSSWSAQWSGPWSAVCVAGGKLKHKHSSKTLKPKHQMTGYQNIKKYQIPADRRNLCPENPTLPHTKMTSVWTESWILNILNPPTTTIIGFHSATTLLPLTSNNLTRSSW